MRTMTYIEQERCAYVSGDTRTASLITEVAETVTDDLVYDHEYALERRKDAHTDDLEYEYERGYEDGLKAAAEKHEEKDHA